MGQGRREGTVARNDGKTPRSLVEGTLEILVCTPTGCDRY
jgi:hypothetical protein